LLQRVPAPDQGSERRFHAPHLITFDVCSCTPPVAHEQTVNAFAELELGGYTPPRRINSSTITMIKMTTRTPPPIYMDLPPFRSERIS
jgi:hypothetical protein